MKGGNQQKERETNEVREETEVFNSNKPFNVCLCMFLDFMATISKARNKGWL